MSKKDFIDALHVVPKSLEDRVFGTIETIGMPSDEESAILAIGRLSANINNQILRPLSGLDVTELLLRVGQRSSTAIAGLLSGLECVVHTGSMKILSPEDNAIYCGFFDEWQCLADGVSAVTVNCGKDKIKLAPDKDKKNTWYAISPVPIGQHKATFTATPKSGEAIVIETAFSVVDWSTFPFKGATYRPEQIDHVSVTAPNSNLKELSVTLFENSYDLVLSAVDTWTQDGISFSTIGNILPGAKKMFIAGVLFDGGVITSVIDFFIETAEGGEDA